MPAARRLWRRVGRRGVALGFFAFLDLVYAYGLAFPTQAARESATLDFVARIMPLEVWAGLWATVGVVCGVQAFAIRDRYGFAAVMGLKVLWGCVFALGGALHQVERGYVSAAVWLSLAGWIGVIAAWPEPGKEVGWTRRSG